jgi:hypothetical protein
MKKIISNSLIAMLLLNGAVAFAEVEGQVNTGAGAVTNADTGGAGMQVKTGADLKPGMPRPLPPPPLKGEIKTVRTEAKAEIKDLRVEAKGEIKDIRTNMSSTTRMEDRGEIKNIRANLASSTKDKREEAREKVADLVKNRVEKRFGQMFRRLQATIEREEGIMARVVTRIDKVKAEGGKTADAEKFVAEAKMHFDEAQTALDNLKLTAQASASLEVSETGAAVTPPATTTKQTLENLKKSASEVEKHLREGHKALENAVKSLRGSGEKPKATTTVPTTVI